MSGGTTEIHKDDEYLVSGTHDGLDSATTLRDMTIPLKSFGVKVDLYIENTTQDTNSIIASVNDVSEITTDDNISWDKDDTYKIYKTGTKNQLLSTQWVDLSRGWKSDKDKLKKGWKSEDIDIDDRGRKKVFGPNQPKKYRYN